MEMRHRPEKVRKVIALIVALLLTWCIHTAGAAHASEADPSPSPTAAPTSSPERTTPDAPVGPAPLTLVKQASTGAIAPGQTFNYTLQVITQRDQASIEVRDLIDERIEIVGVDSPSGSCRNAGAVICTVQARAGNPATITIVARSRADVAPGVSLISQASAQDDSNFTAASERVSVLVAAPAPPAAANSAETHPRTGSSAPAEGRARRAKDAAPAVREVPAPVPTRVVPALSRAERALSGALESTPPLPAPATVGAEGASWLDDITTITQE